MLQAFSTLCSVILRLVRPRGYLPIASVGIPGAIINIVYPSKHRQTRLALTELSARPTGNGKSQRHINLYSVVSVEGAFRRAQSGFRVAAQRASATCSGLGPSGCSRRSPGCGLSAIWSRPTGEVGPFDPGDCRGGRSFGNDPSKGLPSGGRRVKP